MRTLPPETLEAQLSRKLSEYAENRSITSVVPVENPLASDEPELLEMSPEQAEATQLCVFPNPRPYTCIPQNTCSLCDNF